VPRRWPRCESVYWSKSRCWCRQAVELSPYPAVERDVIWSVAESVRWADVAATARSAAGSELERLVYQDTYRDRERLGRDRKSLLMTLTLRRNDRTLTNAEADAVPRCHRGGPASRHMGPSCDPDDRGDLRLGYPTAGGSPGNALRAAPELLEIVVLAGFFVEQVDHQRRRSPAGSSDPST